jgi:hypothetical protein
MKEPGSAVKPSPELSAFFPFTISCQNIVKSTEL